MALFDAQNVAYSICAVLLLLAAFVACARAYFFGGRSGGPSRQQLNTATDCTHMVHLEKDTHIQCVNFHTIRVQQRRNCWKSVCMHICAYCWVLGFEKSV